MADDKNKQDGTDRSRVSASDEHELRYVAEKLGVSVERVREAIERVGNDRDKVEEFLRGNK